VISFFAEAQYVGNLDELSRNGIYSIEVWQDWRGRYCVAVTHGYERRMVAGYAWKYRNLREMLSCWRDIRPQSFYRFSEK